jgi:hypothetical protein
MVEPMPITTAITSTLMPDEITLPEDALGEERRLLPERERHQHKARQRRDLELDNQHEELDREDEERRDDDDAAKAEQDDLSKVAEELERTRRNRPDMIEDRLRGGETLGGNEARFQEIGGEEALQLTR